MSGVGFHIIDGLGRNHQVDQLIAIWWNQGRSLDGIRYGHHSFRFLLQGLSHVTSWTLVLSADHYAVLYSPGFQDMYLLPRCPSPVWPGPLLQWVSPMRTSLLRPRS